MISEGHLFVVLTASLVVAVVALRELQIGVARDRIRICVAIAVAATALLAGCSAQSTAIRQAKRDFPGCEVRYMGTWENEVELWVCDGVPVTYEVTPLGGATRRR